MPRKHSFNEISEELLPNASGKIYDKYWNDFLTYCNVFYKDCGMENSPTEECLLAYFDSLTNDGYKASTMWTRYSAIKCICRVRLGLHLQYYARLVALLKQYDKQRKSLPKKAKGFKDDDLLKFVTNASDDNINLVTKVIAIVAYFGGLRIGEELCSMRTSDLSRFEGKGWWVSFVKSKTRKAAMDTGNFIIPEGIYSDKITLYMEKLATDNAKDGRFIWTPACKFSSKKPMGKNTIAQSAMANDAMANEYIQSSEQGKLKCAKALAGSNERNLEGKKTPALSIQGNNSCTINIQIKT